MTMPHLENCPHSEDGWCLSCVKEAHDDAEAEIERLREENTSLQRTNLTLTTCAADYCAQIPRWIPVKERLPPALTTVLCSHAGYGSCFTGYCAGSQWTAWPPGSVADVTHWMPLPEPPSTKEEEPWPS